MTSSSEHQQENQQQQSTRFAVHRLVESERGDGGTGVGSGLCLGDEWDCLFLPNSEVWEAASHMPLAVRLKWWPGSQKENTAEDNVSTTATTTKAICWAFLIEANTPAITAVQTFEDFEAHVFVGVPLVLTTGSIFTKSVRVDWYSSDCDAAGLGWQEEQRDSPCFIAAAHHVGKRLAVILTPVGVAGGGEEAYIFARPVEECPENILLRLRGPDWATPILQQQNRQHAGGKKGHNDYGNGSNSIRIVTYNILADQNAYSDNDVNFMHASYVSPEVMHKKRRLPLILHELLAYQADVICLQEVDKQIYFNLLEPVLRHFQYQGVYSRKHTKSKLSDHSLTTSTNEGCAMFWSLN